MQINASETLKGHIEEIFDALSDFAPAEQAAMDRGMRVERLDALAAPAAGMRWKIGFFARGREREADVELVKTTRPTFMQFEGKVGGLFFQSNISCRVADTDATEVTVVTKLKPQAMTARMLVQSLKLARRRVNRRYKMALGRLLRDVESRARATTSESGPS